MNCEACESLHQSTKMCRTSEYVQLRLLSFYESNAKFAKAVRELFSVEGIKLWPSIISGLNGTFLLLTCLVAATLERRHFAFIDQSLLEQNNELILMPMFAICK